MNAFEQRWTTKLANNLTKQFGSAYRDKIMKSTDFTKGSLHTTRSLLENMMQDLSERRLHDALTEVACFYPHDALEEFRDLYRETGQIALVHEALQHQFETDIVTYKNLSQEQLAHIRTHDWGVAGKLVDEHTLIATKIPSQFHEYFEVPEGPERNAHYCHCPRIRDAIRAGEEIPYRYCYCGGGYYRDLWRYITKKEVSVEITQSILKGDPVCQFTIHIE